MFVSILNQASLHQLASGCEQYLHISFSAAIETEIVLKNINSHLYIFRCIGGHRC